MSKLYFVSLVGILFISTQIIGMEAYDSDNEDNIDNSLTSEEFEEGYSDVMNTLLKVEKLEQKKFKNKTKKFFKKTIGKFKFKKKYKKINT